MELLGAGHADDPAVATCGDCLDPVLGLAPSNRPQPRTEADEELGDFHAAALGGDEVAELVQDDHDDQRNNDEQEISEPEGEEDGGDGSECRHEPDERPQPTSGRLRRQRVVDLWRLDRVGHPTSLPPRMARVTSRARPSAWSTASRESSGSGSYRSNTAATVSAIARQPIAPVKNASTATSLDPLSQAGAAPPIRPAS